MKRSHLKTLMLLCAGLLLMCCSDSHTNYPDDYVGFDKTYINYTYNSSAKEDVIHLKVLAVDKKKEERKVRLSVNMPPVGGDRFQLCEQGVLINAGKKEANATVKVFPGKVVKGLHIHVTCTPQWKNAETTKTTIQLTPK